MKKSQKAILFIIIVLGIPLISTISISAIILLPPVPKSSNEPITFMTYNIHFGVGMDDMLDLERLTQNILVANPDVLGLQEVENGRITSQGIDMTFWLAERLGMHYYYYPAVNEAAFGCALLSKFPILSVTGYDLTSTELERVLVHGVVQVNSSFTMNVFVVHMGLSNENTTRQIEEVLTITNSTSGAKVLMGDFNLLNDTNQIKNVTQLFNDTAAKHSPTPGATFPSFPAPEVGNRIDYIFATNYINIEFSYVITDFLPGIHTAAEFGSDHLPIVARIRF